MNGLAKNCRYCECAKYRLIALVGKSHKSENPEISRVIAHEIAEPV
jgi:hypothetical protein